jgi:N-succinyldiaminopimelate aminotransferase
VNPRLAKLNPYPFERLKHLLAGVTPNPNLRPLNMSIGEPKHASPSLIGEAMQGAFGANAAYPATAGSEALRNSIANWITQRYQLPVAVSLDQVLPVNGSREALFALAQTVINPDQPDALVICPNPFYQIYEGAAILAGATPWLIEQDANQRFACNWSSISDDVWKRTQLLFVCSPGNPTGRVMTLDEWRILFALSDQYGFVIAADECYSEIWFDQPPLGAIEAAARLGRQDFKQLVVFSSLSKRSNVPGMRSGFVAGDAKIMKQFLLYRTYHGSAMSPVVQAASIAAWNDEAHVEANRVQYRKKFDEVTPIIQSIMRCTRPEAGFYLWGDCGMSDEEFVLRAYRDTNVHLLPGSYLGRPNASGKNPAQNFVRIALVEPLEQCVEAAQRLAAYFAPLTRNS